MAESGSDTFLATIVESHYTTVGEGQLQLPLTLLTGYLASHGAVYLVGKPVLAGHGLHLEYTLHIFIQFLGVLCTLSISHFFIMALHGLVAHDSLRRVTEHLGHIEVEGLHTVGLHEREMGVTGGIAHHVQGSALTLGNLPDMFDMLLIDEQTHTLLTLVGDNLFGRKGLVANGQLGHVDATAAVFHQFGETVQVTG